MEETMAVARARNLPYTDVSHANVPDRDDARMRRDRDGTLLVRGKPL